MTKFLQFVKPLIVTAACGCVAFNAIAAGPTLYAVRSYNEGDRMANGLYSVSTEPGSQPQLEWADGDMMGNGGVVYCDGTLYVLSYLNFYGEIYYVYQVCDVEKKEYTFTTPTSNDLELVTDVAAATTYDPTTATAYAITLAKGSTTEKPMFALNTINLTTAKKTPVAVLSQQLYTLACTANGQMYGIGADGVLYKVNKYNGELTRVGDTGIIPQNNQCAVIDYETNIMYWHSSTGENTGALRTVDINTGKSTLLSQFSPSFQLYGLFIKQKALSTQAPAAPENIVASFEGASLNGTLDFTLPKSDINGNPLSSNIDWQATLDGNVLSSGSGQPGELVKAPISVEKAGSYRFLAQLSCGKNIGESASTQLWVGMDTPMSATDIKLSADKHTVTVSWSLPERGIHDGYVDHSKVRWLIDRGPEDVAVADDYESMTFTETLEGRSGTYPVLYRITPYIDDLYGQEVISTYVRAGEPFVVPVSIDLTDPFNSLIFDVVDANSDEASWYWDYDHESMSCMWPISDDRCRDDWMISEAISLEAGQEYILSLEMASDGRWNYETQHLDDIFSGEIAAYLGTSNELKDLTRCIMEKEDVEKAEWFKRYGKPFSVDKSGIYYVGVHSTGMREVRNIYNTLIRSFAIEMAASLGSTAADANFRVVAAAGGLLVENPDCKTVRIFTPAGALVATTSEAQTQLSLQSGIYIAVCGNQSVKIAVR